jgi:hypothetical protein
VAEQGQFALVYPSAFDSTKCSNSGQATRGAWATVLEALLRRGDLFVKVNS